MRRRDFLVCGSAFLTAPVFAVAPDDGCGAGRARLQEAVHVTNAPYNAVSDGVSDDTAAVQMELDNAGGRLVMLPARIKFGAVVVPSGTGLVGSAQETSIHCGEGSYDLVTVAGSDVVLSQLSIQGGAKTGGFDIRIATGTSGLNRIELLKINAYGGMGFLADSGSGSHTTTRIRKCQAAQLRGPGVAMTRGFAFIFVDELALDYTNTPNSNVTGFSFDGSAFGASGGGLVLENVDVLGTAGLYANGAQVGFSIANTAAVHLRRCSADTLCGAGFDYNNVQGLFLDDVTASLVDGHGHVFTAVRQLLGSKIFHTGRNRLPAPSADKDGLRFVSGCAGVNVSGVLSQYATGNGINKLAAQTGAILISGASMFNNTGRGLVSDGNSALNVVGAQFGSNAAGNYRLGGAYDYLSMAQLDSGFVSALLGPGPISG